ncbi:MAG: iron-containing alcohol dehydrogenase [Oleispira sp.]|nr:iron-containing alcohol dehydrogenase [Oleispira sp.]
MPDWNYPTAIKFGNGRIKELSKLCEEFNMHCPLIVTDPGLAHFSFMMKIEQSLPCAGIFSAIKANPNGSNIEAGVTAFKHGKHDGIIAIGGGSALDAGKAIALMAGQSQSIWDFEDIGDNWKKVDAARMITTIAIPTTAGTGSEVGRAAVIVNEDSHSKKIIFHPLMLPKCVILDPELSQALPAPLTAATGLDAFVHNFEAFCAPSYHPMADGIALQGMKMIKDCLPEAYRNGRNLEARGNMLTASMMGATAFQKGLGACHALAHPLGALYDKHHGLLNAIIIPYVVNTNASVIEEKLQTLCQYLSIEKDLPHESYKKAFLGWLLAFRKELDIPNSLADIDIHNDDVISREHAIGELAFSDPSASGNPVPLTAAQYQTLFQQAVDGELII